MRFAIRDRTITGDRRFLISYNADYIAEFEFADSEWDGKIKTARFKRGSQYVDVILEDDKCTIPAEVLKNGFMHVGVYTDNMTTTKWQVVVCESIKDSGGSPAAPTPDVYAQIIGMIEAMSAGAVSSEQIEDAVGRYFADNPMPDVGQGGAELGDMSFAINEDGCLVVTQSDNATVTFGINEQGELEVIVNE